jgi:CubicO group peptidase (beta-lactamase class C family)
MLWIMDENNHQQIDKLVNKLTLESGFPGSVIITQGNDVTYDSYKYDLTRPFAKQININTSFNLSSGAKVFTAIALFKLASEQILSLDEKITTYLGHKYKFLDSEITVKHLITHFSGVEEYFNEFEENGYEKLWKIVPAYNVRNTTDYECLINNIEMRFKPGEMYQYNNAGFIILGIIVEKLSAMKFVDYVEENIFKQVDMSRAGYFELDKLPDYAVIGNVYDNSSQCWKSNIYMIPARGGGEGGAFCSANDLNKLWRSIRNNTLLGGKVTQEFLRPQIQDGCDGEWFYAHGFWVNFVENEVFKYSCVGEDPGCSVRFNYYHEYDISIAVMSNVSQGSGKLSVEIQRLLFKEVNWESDQPATLQACNIALDNCTG